MSPLTRPLRVLIADDRARTRRALRALLGTVPDLEVVGEAVDGATTAALVERLTPDVLLLDVCLPGLDGVATTGLVAASWPHVRIVGHSLALERRAEMLAAGAAAFVPKGCGPEELVGAILAA